MSTVDTSDKEYILTKKFAPLYSESKVVEPSFVAAFYGILSLSYLWLIIVIFDEKETCLHKQIYCDIDTYYNFTGGDFDAS